MLLETKQKTLKNETVFSGKALQSGVEVKVVCMPATENTGIVFKRVDLEGAPEINLAKGLFSGNRERRTTIGYDGTEVQTVEHLLAALWALEIDNIVVEINNIELPALDGSAIDFFCELEKAGIKEQTQNRKTLKVTEPETIKDGDREISVFPDDVFGVVYSIDYPTPSIRKETFEIKPDKEVFFKELAPARTFCLKEEAEALLRSGLGKGATYENTLIMDVNGPIETTLRFANEPVRHKVLDLIGDFYILGIPIIGKVSANKSGHGLNLRMIKRLYEKYISIE